MKVSIDKLELVIVPDTGKFSPKLLRELGAKYDTKTKTWRILPYQLHNLLGKLNIKLEFSMDFTLSDALSNRIEKKYNLREYQEKAIHLLKSNDWRGVIVLPTGAGKTIIGIDAIYNLRVKSLIVVPTLDLMNQWIMKLQESLNIPRTNISLYGGGRKEIGEITIVTYASAKTKEFLEKAIDKFGLIIFDEAHRLLGELNKEIAKRLIAPYRIGLTATPGGKKEEKELEDLIGKVFKVSGFKELVDKGYLAPFDHHKIYVKLTEEEAKEYQRLMEIYLSYVKRYNVDDEIERFKMLLRDSVSDPDARRAIIARLKAKRIALNARDKLRILEELLEKHKNDKVIIFTRYQDSAKLISIKFGIPYVVGDMSKEERNEILSMFKRGIISKLVTAEVLDEGIDIPSASVGIILAGKPSKRQLIQRIGRILRPMDGKKAVIYEVITSKTYDYFASRKRRIKLDSL